MRAQITYLLGVLPGCGSVDVSHGKEKHNDGRMTEAPEWTICVTAEYPFLNCG